MTEASANSLVFTSALVTAGSTAARYMLPTDEGGKGSLPPVRTVIGTAVAFTILAMTTPFAPNFAGAWALLIMTVAVLNNGAPLLDKFFNA